MGSALLALLREQHGPELAAIVSSAAQLQLAARAKLSPPGKPDCVWWVSDKSLQQATPWQVARIKADWFGEEPIHDLCCGIGGDAIQLAARGIVTAVELDPVTAAMADANLRGSGDENRNGRVVCADVTTIDLQKGSAFHLDPDRRPVGRRRSDPHAFQPSWPEVSKMLERASGAVIKLAPASTIPEDRIPPTEFHRSWISLAGSVREQSLLWGSAIDRAARVRGECSAVVLRSDGSAELFAPSETTTPSARSKGDRSKGDRPPSVLVDPNGAIRAAGLTDSFAARFELGLLNGPSGFLGGEDPSIAENDALGSLAVSGRVRWWGACDDRKLRKEFRALDVFPETIKVRGTDHDPAALFKRYRRCGERPVTLWIGRHGKRVFAAITH